jgi:hypothetical protein
MTEKELLYVEDILEHEKDFKSICEYYSNEIEDKNVKDLLDNIVKSQEQNYKKVFNLLDE